MLKPRFGFLGNVGVLFVPARTIAMRNKPARARSKRWVTSLIDTASVPTQAVERAESIFTGGNTFGSWKALYDHQVLGFVSE